MDVPKEITVCPISGGSFPIQLGLFSLLADCKYDTLCMLASSGGNVAAYTAHAANFNRNAIERISRGLSSRMFLQPWSNAPVISALFGFFTGSMFKEGSGAMGYFDCYFTPDSVQSREIWTGTYDRQHQRGQYFCNRSQEQSYFGDMEWPCSLTRCHPPIWVAGDLETISKVSIASASIPGLIPAIQFNNGQQLMDGGLSAASPLSPMNSVISTYLPHRRHVVYVNGVNVDLIDLGGVGNSLVNNKGGDKSGSSSSSGSNDEIVEGVSGKCNVLNSGVLTLSELIMAQIVADRGTAHGLISQGQSTHHVELPATITNLQKVLDFRLTQNCVSSLLELAPSCNRSLSVTSFTGVDVCNLLEWTRNNAIIRFWWVGDGDPCY